MGIYGHQWDFKEGFMWRENWKRGSSQHISSITQVTCSHMEEFCLMSITCIFINELQVHSFSAAKENPFLEEKDRDNNQWELKIDFEEDLWLFKGESWRSKKTFMTDF